VKAGERARGREGERVRGSEGENGRVLRRAQHLAQGKAQQPATLPMDRDRHFQPETDRLKEKGDGGKKSSSPSCDGKLLHFG